MSPFEQITQLENEQEARVQQALESFNAEEREAEKAMAASEKLHEEKMREEAREDLREYAKTEPAAILQKSEDETAEDLKATTKQYEKTSGKALASLVDAVLDLSFKV